MNILLIWLALGLAWTLLLDWHQRRKHDVGLDGWEFAVHTLFMWPLTAIGATLALIGALR